MWLFQFRSLSINFTLSTFPFHFCFIGCWLANEYFRPKETKSVFCNTCTCSVDRRLIMGSALSVSWPIQQENVSVKCIPPLLYSKTGVCGGIPNFLIFAPKHRLWVLVRTASLRRF